MEYSSLQSDSFNTPFIQSTWIPQQNQVGSHIVCALAEDSLGKRSESRCLTIVVKDVSPCSFSPCKHGGTCVRQGQTQNYVCNCGPGISGNLCETDIDECASNPCQNNGTCNDHINQYNCTCVEGYSGYQCQTDIDECSPLPCQHNGTCTDAINMYTCACPLGFTGLNCESGKI
ncbi:fibropellin-3-like [Magallana gigas]|uniref:fibropellin-3-like n=1 Tax=Magallana gigas TaxID=29159 RepID=UPI00333E8DF3